MNQLAKIVVNKLIKKKIKISIAESCTGGLLSSTITSIKNSSKILILSLIAYSNKSKIEILKIPKKILKKHGAVSEETCLAMVEKISKLVKTSLSISITGIAGPGGATRKKPVGLVYISIKRGNKTKIKKYLFKNKGRIFVQKSAVNSSLKLILSAIK